jgi:hypothetical protein
VTPTNTPTVVTVNVAGGAGTSIADAAVVIWNAGLATSADTAAEINTLLAAQNGDFNGGVLVAAYTNGGTDVGIYYDSDAPHHEAGPACASSRHQSRGFGDADVTQPRRNPLERLSNRL